MDKTIFISMLQKIDTVKSKQGITYSIDSVDDKYIIGTRFSTKNPFKIKTDSLFQAYNDVLNNKISNNTSELRDYVNRVQSPAVAIINKLQEYRENIITKDETAV